MARDRNNFREGASLGPTNRDEPRRAMGTGSGLDADMLDGQHGPYYLARANHTGTQLASTISDLATAVGLLNAATATTLQTGRTISTSGDATGTSPAFNGSAAVTIPLTLATVNANVGAFGSATQAGTFTVNAKGLITTAANVTITPAASSITGGGALTKTDDTNVTLTLGGTPGSALLAATSITAGWTGRLAYSRFIQATQKSLVGATSAGDFGEIMLGSGVAITAGVLSATGTGGTVTTVSVTTANGVSGSVANPTTTPAITLTLGAITPASVAATGTIGGSNLSGTNTGDQVSIVGITGTKAQFNTAATDGDFLYTDAIGVSVQAYDADLTTLGAGGSGARDFLGLGTGDSPQFTAINIGAATDTTITRTGAGDIAVEGNALYRAGGTDVPVADGGTGRSTSTTAYGLIAAGTTATGAHQTLAAGATTEILVGGGASALPVWTTATGTGAPVRAGSPTFTGVITAAVDVLAGSFAAGRIYYDSATHGIVVVGKAGGTNDFLFASAAGNILLRNPTGTSNLRARNFFPDADQTYSLGEKNFAWKETVYKDTVTGTYYAVRVTGGVLVLTAL